MTKLRLELTEKCNFNCIFCHGDQIQEKSLSNLNAEDYKFLVSTAKNVGIGHVVLSGGEPLSRPDINEIIEKIHECSVYLQITTNGTFLNKINNPQFIDGLNISLHSIDLIAHKKITGQNFALPNIIQNIEQINKYKNIKKKINVVALKTLTISQQNLKQLLNLCVDCDADLKIIELLNKNNQEFVSNEEVKDLLLSMGFKVIKTVGRNIYLSNTRTNVILQKCFCQFAKDQPSPSLVCHQFNDLFILPSGRISYCRLSNNSIDILQEIKNRNEKSLQTKLKNAVDYLGETCPYKKQ